MGFHLQRKRVDYEELAIEIVRNFRTTFPNNPHWKVVADYQIVDDATWVYVLQLGPFVDSDQPLLPDYELVAFGN